MNKTLIESIFNLGSISGLISLFYLVAQNLRKRPRFSLDFRGCSDPQYEKEGIHWYRYSYTGVLKNQSIGPNTVTRFYWAVHGNKRKKSALRIVHLGAMVVDKDDDTEIKLPIQFSPREAKHLGIAFDVPIRGTFVEELFPEHAEVKADCVISRYEICIEDVSGNIFDSAGKLVNLDEINLRSTFPNTVRELKQGKIGPFMKHSWRIVISKFSFRVKWLFQGLGLWK